MDKWIAFFSQTGSEIVTLSRALERKPDLIVTNNFEDKLIKFHPGVRELGITIMQGKHDALMNYFDQQQIYASVNTIITLHGYLRIIPEHICNKYSIYNGHPGAIDLYPELKGKDPQARTWDNKEKYKLVGSVVHKVTPGVDEGEIIKTVKVINRNYSLNEMYETLKMTSLSAWTFALKELKL
jgi:folate-dependent phosphoribosylglycinamide formyltransferase PurN